MRERRIERLKAVAAKSLCDDCDNCHKNSHKTVLKDAEVNNLCTGQPNQLQR